MADFSKNLEAFGLTDVGRKRKRNEDFFRYVIPTPNSPEERLGAFFVVADGIGGMGFGEEASTVATNTLLATYYDPKNPDPDPMNRLQIAMQVANNAVIAKAGELGRTLIGTTAAGIIVHPREVVLFNVGDARVYRIRGNSIERISKDQSVLEEQLALGLITEEEAAQGRNMNVTAFVGQPGGVEPIYSRIMPQADDIFLICSDGLWDLVKEAELVQIITKNPPESAMQQLVAMVLDRGAPDNTTGIIVRLSPFKKKMNPLVPILVALALMIGIAMGVLLISSGNNNNNTLTDNTQTVDSTEESSNVTIITSEVIEITPDATADVTEIPIDTIASVDVTDEPVTVDETAEVTQAPIDTITSIDVTNEPVSVAAVDTTPDLTDEPREETPETRATADSIASVVTNTPVIIIITATDSPSNTPSPTPEPTNTIPPTPTSTASPTETASATITTTPTATNSATPTSEPTATATLTKTPEPPTATLDTESLTLLAPFTATARAQLPPATQTELSIQETQAAIDLQNTQTQVAFDATLTVVFTQTVAAQTLQAVQTQVIGTATARAEITSEYTPDADITPPAIENLMVVVTDEARLYKLPNTRSELLVPLLFGDELTVFGIDPTGTWFFVEIRNQIQGWVQRFPNNQLEAYVSGTLVENLPLLDPDRPSAPSEELFGVHLIVTNDVAVNVREYASFNQRANVFAGLPPYSVARIDATNPSQTWLRVSFLSRTNRSIYGWVSATLIADESIMVVGDLDSVIKITPLPLPEPEGTEEAPTDTPEVTEPAP